MAESTNPNGAVTRFAYDALDRLTRVTDAMQQATAFGYDALGRRISLTASVSFGQPALVETRAFTDNGQLASVTNANGHTVGFAYDGFDRLATTTYPRPCPAPCPGPTTETLTYDADSNVLTAKDRAGDVTSFAYDSLNRLVTLTPPNGEPVVSYRYDQAGRVTTVSDTSSDYGGLR